jgi:hypothetical protein
MRMSAFFIFAPDDGPALQRQNPLCLPFIKGRTMLGFPPFIKGE